jgi:short-subunit dehydrogenase
MNPIEKQTVLITGATGGLGKAFALECARRGWELYLTDQSLPGLEILAAKLRQMYGAQVWVSACNLANQKSREELLAEVKARKLRFSMLINVAGIDFEGLFLNQPKQNLFTLLHLNVEAPLELMHEMIRLRKTNSVFRIINVSSMAAFYPMPYKAAYAASKRFLLDLSRAVNSELRQENASITVLCPAGMPTNPWCIQAIEAQGWAGQVTTMDVGRVAYQTLEAALQGKAVVVPGWINRLVQMISSLVPTLFKMQWIASRWEDVRSRRIIRGEVQTL